MRRPTQYVRVKLTYYEATVYWLAAGATISDPKRAQSVLGKNTGGRSPVAAARRAHKKLGRAWREAIADGAQQ